MGNRLKVIRKARRMTQSGFANLIGITQNTYSYWETGKVKIDNESLKAFADKLEVSLDFLSGRSYRITKPVTTWRKDLQEDYKNADVYLKEYLEYKHGCIAYTDDPSECSEVIENNKTLDEFEEELLTIYNKMTVLQKARLLTYANDMLKEN